MYAYIYIYIHITLLDNHPQPQLPYVSGKGVPSRFRHFLCAYHLKNQLLSGGGLVTLQWVYFKSFNQLLEFIGCMEAHGKNDNNTNTNDNDCSNE